jgi:hypothetical protein
MNAERAEHAETNFTEPRAIKPHPTINRKGRAAHRCSMDAWPIDRKDDLLIR